MSAGARNREDRGSAPRQGRTPPPPPPPDPEYLPVLSVGYPALFLFSLFVTWLPRAIALTLCFKDGIGALGDTSGAEDGQCGVLDEERRRAAVERPLDFVSIRAVGTMLLCLAQSYLSQGRLLVDTALTWTILHATLAAECARARLPRHSAAAYLATAILFGPPAVAPLLFHTLSTYRHDMIRFLGGQNDASAASRATRPSRPRGEPGQRRVAEPTLASRVRSWFVAAATGRGADSRTFASLFALALAANAGCAIYEAMAWTISPRAEGVVSAAMVMGGSGAGSGPATDHLIAEGAMACVLCVLLQTRRGRALLWIPTLMALCAVAVSMSATSIFVSGFMAERWSSRVMRDARARAIYESRTIRANANAKDRAAMPSGRAKVD